MLPLSYLRTHGRLIAFGLFMCFASSPGQTFFISLSGGEIRAAFGLSHGEYGTLYAAGTLTSAALLVWLGRLVDRIPLAVFSGAALTALGVTCLVLGWVEGMATLFLALLGLRLFGQGLASHAAITAMARYFRAERGRAIGIASLGHSLGEALFPALVVAMLAIADWRTLWSVAGITLFLMTPLVFFLLRGHAARDQALRAKNVGSDTADVPDRTLSAALRDPGLWLLLPALLAPSFIFTGTIFHQVHLATSKGWPLSLMAGSFTLFAVASVVSLVITGRLVDWFSAQRLIPFFLLPLALACLTLGVSDSTFAAPLALVLIGVNSGATAVILGALWAERYGIAHLGAIRAFAHAAMVFSSGLAPAIMGLLIDDGFSMETIVLASGVFCLAASALATLSLRNAPAASEAI